MDRFPAAVYHHGHGELKLPDNGVLLVQWHIVGFYKGIAEVRHILVFDAFAVQRIETDPCAGLFLVVAEYRADVAVTFSELLDELSCGAIV